MRFLPSPPASSGYTAAFRYARAPSTDDDTPQSARPPKRRAREPLPADLPPGLDPLAQPPAGSPDPAGFAAPGPANRVDDPDAGPADPSPCLLDRIADYLRAHPGPEGHRTRELVAALQEQGVEVSHKQVSSACNKLTKAHPGFIASKTEDRHKRYRVAGVHEVAEFVCPRREWPMLLAMANGDCRDYQQLRGVTGTNRNQVNVLVARLRASGAAFHSHGLPRLDLQNRCLRRELASIHRMLFPLRLRSRLPAHPQPEPYGRETYLRFLSAQPPHEWFSGTELAQHFDTQGRTYRVSDCLKRAVVKGWVEVRYDDRYCSYRLHPAYRAEVAEAARGLDWTRLLPPRPAAATTAAPVAADAGADPNAAAAATAGAGTAASLARPGPPPRLRLLPDMDGFLKSRGIAATVPGQAERALDFLAGRQPSWQAARGAVPVTSRSVLVRTLEAAPGGHALLCLSAPPAYLETWRDGIGVWRARSLVADAGRGIVEPLFLTAARFFDGPGPAVRSLDVIHLQDTPPARWF